MTTQPGKDTQSRSEGLLHDRYPAPMESGSWADWVNVVGTYLAVAGAVFAGFTAWRGYKLQRDETRREIASLNEEKQRRHDEERSAQASKVAYWITRGHAEWHVSGANTSGLPIFNLVLRMYGDDPMFSVAVTRGTQGPDDVGRSRKLANVLEVILVARDALDVNPSKVHLDIVFTDAAGTRWLRTEDGKLHAVHDDFEFENVDERLVDRLVPLRSKT